jgi:hypothetical protein
MQVRNFSEFYNLIKHMNLQTTSPFDNFINTVDKYKAACDCVNHVDRLEKKKAATTQYISMAKGIFGQYARKTGETVLIFNEGKLICKY